MEYEQDKITPEQYEELKKVARDNVCSECGAELQIHTNPERRTVEVGCLNKAHHGFTERASYTELMRRGETLPDFIKDNIAKRMLPRNMTAEDFQRSMGLVHAKYPDVLKDPATAALFLMDCMRLDLDPLVSPAEVVPAVFNKKQKEKGPHGEDVWLPIVVEIVTEDGQLSGAARAEPNEWAGPPKTMPLQDYLMTLEHLKGRPLEDIEKIAKRQAKDLCQDENAWVWVALGRRKSDTTETQDLAPAYGWYTTAEQKEDAGHGLVAGKLPGNQARVRAIKRWVRESYPAWRQKMIAMTSEWLQRADGVKDAEKLIEGQYKMVIVSPPAIGAGQQQKQVATASNRRADPPEQSGGAQGSAPPTTGAQSSPAGTAGSFGETEPPEVLQDRSIVMECYATLTGKKQWSPDKVRQTIRDMDPSLKNLPRNFMVNDIPRDQVHTVANKMADLADAN